MSSVAEMSRTRGRLLNLTAQRALVVVSRAVSVVQERPAERKFIRTTLEGSCWKGDQRDRSQDGGKCGSGQFFK